ncbi:hypothetical protein AVEN_158843-1 [Araneus ventricosus]|uniref:Uncharacterized protein n=1 Tax=Araneus ventricosus TaxID=182803 RepID=A0A4Y2MW41_ARAVE|nr:hypothetical protein AVEN_158843-1 [Araneus ventricosus]
MLQIYAIPQMLHLQLTVTLEEVGVPPHWGTDVRAFSDTTFRNRWLGRGGSIVWLPRSPDVTPLDFFFWCYIKDKVYSREIRDVADLRASTPAATATVTTEML